MECKRSNQLVTFYATLNEEADMCVSNLDESVIGASEENVSGKDGALDIIRVLVTVRGDGRDLMRVFLVFANKTEI